MQPCGGSAGENCGAGPPALFTEDVRLQHFYALLAEKGRFPLLPDIVEEYQRLERKQKGEGLCRLRCARDPGDQALGALARRLCKKYGYQSLTFAIELDPAVLGGFVLEIDGVTYDKSVQGQLHALAQNLREGENIEAFRGNYIHSPGGDCPV